VVVRHQQSFQLRAHLARRRGTSEFFTVSSVVAKDFTNRAQFSGPGNASSRTPFVRRRQSIERRGDSPADFQTH